jgi:hypothetical protein
MSNVGFNALRDKIETLKRQRLKNGGGPPQPPTFKLLERIIRIEEAIVGLRHSQNLVVALGAIVVALIVGFGIYSLQRIDNVNDRVASVASVASEVSAIRQEVSGISSTVRVEAAEGRKELIGITTAISAFITAARQSPLGPAQPE